MPRSGRWTARVSEEHDTRFLTEDEAAAATASGSYAFAPGEGEQIAWPGVEFTLLAGTEQSGGSLSVLVDRSDRMTIPWHVHEDDEAFFILDGRYRLECGDELLEAGPGGFVFLPRGVPHQQMVLSEEGRKLVLSVPAGIEGFFRGMAAEVNAGTLTPERRQALAREHRMEFLER